MAVRCNGMTQITRVIATLTSVIATLHRVKVSQSDGIAQSPHGKDEPPHGNATLSCGTRNRDIPVAPPRPSLAKRMSRLLTTHSLGRRTQRAIILSTGNLDTGVRLRLEECDEILIGHHRRIVDQVFAGVAASGRGRGPRRELFPSHLLRTMEALEKAAIVREKVSGGGVELHGRWTGNQPIQISASFFGSKWMMNSFPSQVASQYLSRSRQP